MTRKSGKHCVQHTEPLDSCFDLISSHQQCISWSLPLRIKSLTTECRAESIPLWFSGYRNWIYNIIPPLKKRKYTSISLPMWLWLRGCVSPTILGRRSPGGDRFLCKSTDVTTRHISLIGRVFTMTSTVVEFRLCILWSSMNPVYTANET